MFVARDPVHVSLNQNQGRKADTSKLDASDTNTRCSNIVRPETLRNITRQGKMKMTLYVFNDGWLEYFTTIQPINFVTGFSIFWPSTLAIGSLPSFLHILKYNVPQTFEMTSHN